MTTAVPVTVTSMSDPLDDVDSWSTEIPTTALAPSLPARCVSSLKASVRASINRCSVPLERVPSSESNAWPTEVPNPDPTPASPQTTPR